MAETQQYNRKSWWYKLNPNCKTCEEIRIWREANPHLDISERDKIYIDRDSSKVVKQLHPHITTEKSVPPSWQVDHRKRNNGDNPN